MAAKTFADALKQARKAAGMSQAALARGAGLTGSYISVLESRRRPPPSPRVVRAICKVLGIEDEPLQEAAALERSPAPVRKRLARMRRERGRASRSRDRLLTTTLFHVARRPGVVDPMSEFLDLEPGQQALLGKLVGRIRKVRSLSEAESRSKDLLQDTSAKDRDALVRVLPRVLSSGAAAGEESELGADVADEPAAAEPVAAPVPVYGSLARQGTPKRHLTIDPALWGREVFFWEVGGDDAYPHVESGDLLLIDPLASPTDGDLVAFSHGGRDRVGTLSRRGGRVHLAFPRPDVPPIRIPERQFRPAGLVTWLLRSLR
ncbi:MAG: helix-turn-helix domain-containing protein [Planctomycetota bacterium]